MIELNRFLRHAFAPFTMWMVANGYMPEYMQEDVIEVAVIGASVAVPIAWSKWRDK